MTIINKAADSHEIRPLTGIRGVAASLVVCLHFKGWVVLLPGLAATSLFTTGEGGLGVDLFFILSGFILSYVYNAGAAKLNLTGYGRFLWFRFARVYPVHLATLTCLGIMVLGARMHGIKMDGDYPWQDLPAQLTMTHVWPFVPHGLPAGTWNFPSWSISAEWFAYLFIFPITASLLHYHWGTARSIILAYSTLAIWLFIRPRLSLDFLTWSDLLQVSCEFFAGSMLFNLYLRRGSITLACQRYLSFIVLIIFVLFTINGHNGRDLSSAIILFFPPLILGLTSEESWVSQLLATPVALWLGKVSYALYMSHALTLKLLRVVLPKDHYANSPLFLRLLVLCTQISLILVVAAAFYYIVEVPARNYLRAHRPAWMNRPH
jgi:peptidoglycan/LPS O-acetylase OafA/YrhL